jgi:hypothetical protein
MGVLHGHGRILAQRWRIANWNQRVLTAVFYLLPSTFFLVENGWETAVPNPRKSVQSVAKKCSLDTPRSQCYHASIMNQQRFFSFFFFNTTRAAFAPEVRSA